MSGHNMSVGTMVNSFRGLDVYRQNARIRNAELNPKLTQAMRTLYSANGLGEDDDTMNGLYEEILSGKTKVNLTKEKKYQAETTLIGADTNIDLNTDGLSELDMGVILAHEAYRDGIDSGDLQKMETVNAAIQHMNVAYQVAASWGYDGLNADIGGEARAFENGLRYGDWDAVKQAVGRYDSSSDFWKLTKDGQLIFDRKNDLYDEDGKLLALFEGEGGFRESLGYHLGISWYEAEQLMIEQGWSWNSDLRTYTTDGVDVTGSLDRSIAASAQMQASYGIQWQYIDNVFEEYGGDMQYAMYNARNTIENKIELMKSSGQVVPEYLLKQQEMLGGLDQFAESWNSAMFGYGSGEPMLDPERMAYYSSPEVAAAFAEIRDNFTQDDSNPMYRLIGEGKVLDPIEGPDITTVTSHYPENFVNPGVPHGQSSGGTAIDLAPANHENYPVYTMQYETLLMGSDNLGWYQGDSSWSYDDIAEEITQGTGYGYHLRPIMDDFGVIGAHLQWQPLVATNVASIVLQSLIDYGAMADLYRFTLPPGYQIGNVGTTGSSTGEHFHYELRPLW